MALANSQYFFPRSTRIPDMTQFVRHPNLLHSSLFWDSMLQNPVNAVKWGDPVEVGMTNESMLNFTMLLLKRMARNEYRCMSCGFVIHMSDYPYKLILSFNLRELHSIPMELVHQRVPLDTVFSMVNSSVSALRATNTVNNVILADAIDSALKANFPEWSNVK